jgi:uncharacterized membrane protein
MGSHQGASTSTRNSARAMAAAVVAFVPLVAYYGGHTANPNVHVFKVGWTMMALAARVGEG